MQSTEKISILEQFYIACTKPRQYKKLLNVKKWKVAIFTLLMGLVITLLGPVMDLAGFAVSVGGPRNFVMNRLPACELKDGQLKLERAVDFNLGALHISADSNKKSVGADDFDDKYSDEVHFSKNNMVVKTSVMGQTITKNFSTMKNVTFTNQDMANMLPLVYFLIFVSLLFVYAGIVLQYLFYCLLISWLVSLNMKTRNQPMAFGKIFQMSIYARVPCELIGTIGLTAGISFFTGIIWIMIGYLVSYQLMMMGLVERKAKE